MTARSLGLTQSCSRQLPPNSCFTESSFVRAEHGPELNAPQAATAELAATPTIRLDVASVKPEQIRSGVLKDSANRSNPVYCRCSLPHTPEDFEKLRKSMADEINRDAKKRYDKYWNAHAELNRTVALVSEAIWGKEAMDSARRRMWNAD